MLISHTKKAYLLFTQKVRYLAYYLYWNLIRTNSKQVTMPKNLKSWFLYLDIERDGSVGKNNRLKINMDIMKQQVMLEIIRLTSQINFR